MERFSVTRINTDLKKINTDTFNCEELCYNGKMDNLLHRELTYKLRGIFFKIRNTYGPGQKEKVYCNLLEETLEESQVYFEREKSIKIQSLNKKIVGVYKPDFIVDDKIILEIKSSRIIPKIDEKQLYYYLRNSKYEIGFLVNFSTPELFIKRIIYTNDRKPFLSA